MRTFDPSLLVLMLLAALAAAFATPAAGQDGGGVTPEAAPARAAYLSIKTDLQVVLPVGWTGTQSVDELGLPSRAVYRWESTAPDTKGAVVVVERALAINPLLEERWKRGQVQAGYHGMRPVAALGREHMVFGPGTGVEIAAGERLGRAYFVQRGQVLWAVHVAAPAAALAARPGLLGEMASGVRLSDTLTEPPAPN